MRRLRFGGVVGAVVALLFAGIAAPSTAHSKSLQFTGSVTAIDTKARTITVRNYRLAAWKIKRR